MPYFVSLIFVEALCGVHSPGSVQAAKLDILGDTWRLVHEPSDEGAWLCGGSLVVGVGRPGPAVVTGRFLEGEVSAGQGSRSPAGTESPAAQQACPQPTLLHHLREATLTLHLPLLRPLTFRPWRGRGGAGRCSGSIA